MPPRQAGNAAKGKMTMSMAGKKAATPTPADRPAKAVRNKFVNIKDVKEEEVLTDDEEEEEEEFEMLADLNQDDEDDDMEGEDDGQEEGDDPMPKALEKKSGGKTAAASSEALASALSHILGKNLKASAAAAPILARSGVEKRLREDLLESKAKRMIRQDRKKEADVDHVFPRPEDMDYEKRLKKVATRGVVHLFNAIRTQQQTSVSVGGERTVAKADSAKREAAKLDKANFLSLLKGSATPVVKTTTTE